MISQTLYITKSPILPGAFLAALRRTFPSSHHDDDGHISTLKPLYLPYVARAIGLGLGCRIDPYCQIYRLRAGEGVPPHRDPDFNVGGSVARHSVLIRLNGEYEGGETVFMPGGAVEFPVGHALIFSHGLVHGGLPVRRGEKFVLKTDVVGCPTTFPLDEECPE